MENKERERIKQSKKLNDIFDIQNLYGLEIVYKVADYVLQEKQASYQQGVIETAQHLKEFYLEGYYDINIGAERNAEECDRLIKQSAQKEVEKII